MTLREKLGTYGIVLDEPISHEAAEALIGLNELLDHAELTIESLKTENEFMRQILANALGTKTVVVRNTYHNPRLVMDHNISNELIVRVAYD